MTDELRDGRTVNTRRIHIHEPWEVRYWCRLLGVSEEQVRGAVKTVGVMADDVRSYLARSGASN